MGVAKDENDFRMNENYSSNVNKPYLCIDKD